MMALKVGGRYHQQGMASGSASRSLKLEFGVFDFLLVGCILARCSRWSEDTHSED